MRLSEKNFRMKQGPKKLKSTTISLNFQKIKMKKKQKQNNTKISNNYVN